MAEELSGLELREAVARLMGWRTGEYPDPEDPKFPVAVWLGDEVMHLGMPKGWTLADHIARSPHTIPAYESDIAAAWSVVEKMFDKGFRTTLHHGHRPYTDWTCFMLPKGGSAKPLHANTAPEAICKAALAALAARAKA